MNMQKQRLSLALGLLTLVGALTVWGAWSYRPPVAQAQGNLIRYVAPTGANTSDCADPAYPCATVQYAVDRATPGDEVHVATGVYTDVHQRAGITQTVYISKTVTIRGGYSSDFAGLPDPETNPTALDAQGQGRVLYITGIISPTIEGLRITGGDAMGLGSELYGRDAGGGIYILTATVTLRNNQVFSNTAEYYGGGLYLNGSATTLSSNIITSNTAMFGGGLYVGGRSVTLSGNIVATNTATYRGGGLCASAMTATISANLVTGNTARHGGGVVLGAGNILLTGNTITANTAHSIGGPPWLTNAVMPGDEPSPPVEPPPRGGGVYLGGSAATLSGNTIAANTAEEGGGLHLIYSQDTLTNNLIEGNHTLIAGSGVHIEGASPRLWHNTIAHNHGGDGSGIYVTEYTLYPPWYGTIYGTVMLTNTILVSHTVGITVTASNTVTLEATLWGTGTGANGIDWGGAGTIDIGTRNTWGDPAFADPAAGDYHIGPGSAAINAGVDAGVTTDIDGDTRPDWCFPDIGADEFITGQECRYFYLPLVWRS